MDPTTKINPYKNLNLRARLYWEADAMAEAALSRGKEVPAKAVATLEAFEKYVAGADSVPAELMADMVWSHHALAQLLAPATPRTILLLHSEREVNAWVRLLGPISLIRHLMLAAATSLAVFIAVCLSSYTNYVPGKHASIMTADHFELLAILIQYLSAAGLGASFVCLYKANRYVAEGTFDPMFIGSYWIRFFLGLISGLLLAVVINEEVVKTDGTSILEPGIIRVLLAIVGGFSAELFYTFLNRFVEAFKSLFQGAANEMVAAQVQQAKARLAGQQVQDQMQLAAALLRVQQSIGSNANPEEIKQKLNELMNQMLPPKPGGG